MDSSFNHEASLFDSQPVKSDIPIEDGSLCLWHPLLPPEQADMLFTQLTKTLHWQQDSMAIAGKQVLIPRLQAWYGDAGSQYSYSSIALEPLPWTAELLTIKNTLEAITQQPFNSVLANYYRDGNDSVAWHQDNEPELGHNPVIASLSLGETRQFQLRHLNGNYPTVKLNLPHNALLLMSGSTQQYWLHQIPKTKKVVGPRINLTFRFIKH